MLDFFLHSFWGSSSGPCICTANTLLSEPSPWPRDNHEYHHHCTEKCLGGQTGAPLVPCVLLAFAIGASLLLHMPSATMN